MDCMAFLLNVLSHKCSLRFRICHDANKLSCEGRGLADV
jgi:hypothetical protein